MFRRAIVALSFCISCCAFAQTAQVGANPSALSAKKLSIEYVAYRPARYETELVKELDNDPPNVGGFVSAYLKNRSEAPVRLRFWRLNGKDESHWRVDRKAVWDRTYDVNLDPGEMTVVEINGQTDDFAPGKPFNFAYVDETWIGAGYILGTLAEDPVTVSYIRVLPGLQELEVFVRSNAAEAITLGDVELAGKPAATVEWAAPTIDGPGMNIARVKLAAPLASSELFILKINLKDAKGDRAVFAHRRAFADYFPIGTWGGDEDLRDELHRLHIDTCVQGGKKTDSFFARDAERLGMKAMVHTGVITNIDLLRELGDSPHVVCWMIQDEPDWAIPAQHMVLAEQTVRQYNNTVPTFITLCRNVKFPEYAPIADIPCMDHYSVTAPSSSKWPRPWGTRLEETAHYTRDLKAASEPKPIWIWSQGLADWGERPKRPVPTPSELGAQLVLNLSRGAKGILWFSYSQKRGDQYPDVRAAMQGWSRCMNVLRDDLQRAEPLAGAVTAPEKIDASLLAGRDSAVLCLTNTDYEIDAEAYPFVKKENVAIAAKLPAWLTPTTALRLDPAGITTLPVEMRDGAAHLTLDTLTDATLVLLCNTPEQAAKAQAQWDALKQKE
jgi:hypothetical protein